MATNGRRDALLRLAGFGLVLAVGPAVAAGASLDGTWAGRAGDLSTQIIVAGGEVIGFYWRGDYAPVTRSAPHRGGKRIDFAWERGSATLMRDGQGRMHVSVAQKGHAALAVIDLRRD